MSRPAWSQPRRVEMGGITTITIQINQTKSGFLVSGAIDDKAIEADVAKTPRQAALLVRELVEGALEKNQ